MQGCMAGELGETARNLDLPFGLSLSKPFAFLLVTLRKKKVTSTSSVRTEEGITISGSRHQKAARARTPQVRGGWSTERNTGVAGAPKDPAPVRIFLFSIFWTNASIE